MNLPLILIHVNDKESVAELVRQMGEQDLGFRRSYNEKSFAVAEEQGLCIIGFPRELKFYNKLARALNKAGISWTEAK